MSPGASLAGRLDSPAKDEPGKGYAYGVVN